MNSRESLRKELQNWLHMGAGGVGRVKEESKVHSDEDLVWEVGTVLKPLTAIEVRQGSTFMGMDGVQVNFG